MYQNNGVLWSPNEMSGISDAWRYKEKYKLQQNILQGVVVLNGFTIVYPLVEEKMLSLLTV